jgi:hypothetical protein
MTTARNVLAAAMAMLAAACAPQPAALPAPGGPAFQWVSTDPVIVPNPDADHASHAVKDPSVVHANGKYHVFMTTASNDGWQLAYASFRDWSEAPAATIVYLDKSGTGPGYRAAPQVFYFAPQRLWYLIFQGGDPLYSTTANIDDPMSWSPPKPFFKAQPAAMKAALGKGFWLDFWIICNERKCHLFNSGDNGHLYRSETAIADFPNGFEYKQLVLQDADRFDLFEGSMTYKVAGTGTYVTLVEAIGPRGRYYRSWTSDRLDGDWRPLADSEPNPFAGPANVAYPTGRWTMDVSHGELVRSGNDQSMTIDPCRPLRLLYQGVDPNSGISPETDYIKLPYRLGLLTAVAPNPLSAMCSGRPGRRSP